MRYIVQAQVVVMVLFMTTLLYAQTDFYSKRWSEVYRHEMRAQPKSALAIADSIFIRAKQQKNATQVVRALLYKSKFALILEEDAELSIVQNFQREINISKAPFRNILESMLAQLYWQYFQEHRYDYYGRSKTAEKVNPSDFRTWDADMLFREVHRHFQNSLTDAITLQNTPLDKINELLVPAYDSHQYRSTVYDLLAHNAIDFYDSNESLVTKSVDSFELKDPRYFSEFETMILTSPDSLSPLLQALHIYRNLLAFHTRLKDSMAYVNLEVERLRFLVREGIIEDENELQKKSLASLSKRYKHHPSSTLADLELASILSKEGDEYEPLVKIQNRYKKQDALDICNKVIDAFPKSEGAEKCAMLKQNILAPKLEIKCEAYVPVQKSSRLLVTYASIDSMSFDAFRVTEEIFEDFFYAVTDSARFASLDTLRPETTWHIVTKDLLDYQHHSTEVIVPPLPKGRYIVVAYAKGPAIRSSNAIRAYASMQVTNLALLETFFENTYRYQVVDRNSGKPLEGCDIHLKNKRSTLSYLDNHYTSDKNGFIEIKKSNQSYDNIFATVTHNNEQAIFGNYFIYQRYERRNNNDDSYSAKCFFFSDRSIYRPGQTVYFKGIVIKNAGEKSTLVTGQYVKVILNDVNDDEVDTLLLKTNSFGSISGQFKLPASGLTGEYTISLDDGYEDDTKFYDNLDYFDDSEITISVEEYKRPTFEVAFKPVSQTFSVNDTVTVTGAATAYSGSKLSNVQVRYTVRRKVQYPRWYYWYHSQHSSDDEEIEQNEVRTDKSGEFAVKFKAIPDEDPSREDKPVFYYEIKADVTDINAETRSASTTVKVGYHVLEAALTSPEIIDRRNADNVITITTENLNNQFIPAQGTIKIYKLKSPPVPQRRRPWNAPDLQAIPEQEFSKLFPYDPYLQASNPENRENGKLMTELRFNTAVSKEVKFSVDSHWELGRYGMELTTTDPHGEIVTDMRRFTIIDPASHAVADNQLLIFETDKPSYQVGELAHVRIGSAAPDITVTIDVEKNRTITKTYVEHLSNNVKEIVIPVTESMGAGFAVHCRAVCYNAFLSEKKTLQIVPESERMEIETISFKDKLQPGAKETWSFEIKGPDQIKKEAEVLASMYDASLDQFKEHRWSFNPVQRDWYYSDVTTSANNFGRNDFLVTNLPRFYYYIPDHFYDRFEWFGFSLLNSESVNKRYIERLYETADPDNPSRVHMSNTRHGRSGFIVGKITDHSGAPIPGVNIVVKGTMLGTTTGVDGIYELEVGRGQTLVFSFIGYTTAEAIVGRKNTIDVVLEEDITTLQEVVTIGYGTARKSDLTGSIAHIASTTSVSDVGLAFNLQGRVAGVQITGLPGGNAKLYIRGTSTLDGSADPLYVVDGVPVSEYKLDQGDVASVSVLRDASATAIYGSIASHGAIIITTKSGQKKLDEEMAKVNARKNFNETAFFFPQLSTNENGQIRFTFTTPESLTRWKLQLLAYNRDLVSAMKTLQSVTQKEVMVTPNPPRFLRMDDDIVFSAKIDNLTGKNMDGKVALQLTNAVTGENVDVLFKNVVRNQSFKLNAKGTTQVSWKLKVPGDVDAVQYKIVAKAGNYSDGEQNALPVLSNRMLVTETMPMYVREGQTKTYTLEKLKTTTSPTLKHHQLTLEVTSNPAWYAIQSLPYLMEFPHECAEQMFSRYYANALASHVANSNPKIKAVFDKWSSSGELNSVLEKNQELKSIVLQETPWVRDAQSGAEQKKRIALLFDLNTMSAQKEKIMSKLQDMQLGNGAFPWFSGGYESYYITQHIAASYGHLKHLNVMRANDEANNMIIKAIRYLDQAMVDGYNNLLKQAADIRQQSKNVSEGIRLEKAFMERQHISYDKIHYLYMRSFYPEVPCDEAVANATLYYQKQSAQYWKEFGLYMKGMIALIQHRANNHTLANDILISLKENSIDSDEFGMYWKENKSSWYWYEAPVETQALLIEAFSEIIPNDVTMAGTEKRSTVDELRIWLLKNKQTSEWRTTKETTEAIYALLLTGTDWLSLENDLEVTMGKKTITADASQPEAGTGYFKTSWKGDAVSSDMSTVTLTKKSPGMAWAGMYWQYFEDLDKITPAETSIKLSKKVFIVRNTEKGELLTEAGSNTTLAPGDLLRIRIELTTDRDMEFLHMKDMRAAGLEPVDVLSEYKWQQGLGYYQSTKDASTNFFFDNLRKGVYVFEYDLRVNNKGNFSNGITTIQSMYAPEFSSHSEGMRIRVD